jgi:hypothetical protein
MYVRSFGPQPAAAACRRRKPAPQPATRYPGSVATSSGHDRLQPADVALAPQVSSGGQHARPERSVSTGGELREATLLGKSQETLSGCRWHGSTGVGTATGLEPAGRDPHRALERFLLCPLLFLGLASNFSGPVCQGVFSEFINCKPAEPIPAGRGLRRPADKFFQNPVAGVDNQCYYQ